MLVLPWSLVGWRKLCVGWFLCEHYCTLMCLCTSVSVWIHLWKSSCNDNDLYSRTSLVEVIILCWNTLFQSSFGRVCNFERLASSWCWGHCCWTTSSHVPWTFCMFMTSGCSICFHMYMDSPGAHMEHRSWGHGSPWCQITIFRNRALGSMARAAYPWLSWSLVA